MKNFATQVLAVIVLAQFAVAQTTNTTKTNTTTTTNTTTSANTTTSNTTSNATVTPAPAPPANQTFIDWWTGANSTSPKDMVSDSVNVATVNATATRAGYTCDFGLNFSPSGNLGSIEVAWSIGGNSTADWATGARFGPFFQVKKTPLPTTASRLLQATNSTTSTTSTKTNTAAAVAASIYDGWLGIWQVPAASTVATGRENLGFNLAWTGPVDNIAAVGAFPSAGNATSLAWIKNATFTTGAWADSPNAAKRKYVKGTPNKLNYSVGNYATLDLLDQLDNYSMELDARMFWWPATVKPNDNATWTLDAPLVSYKVSSSLTTAVNKVIAAKVSATTGAISIANAAIAVCSVLAMF